MEPMTMDTDDMWDSCIEELRAMDLDRLDDQWLLFIRGRHVFSDVDEGLVLRHARESHPDDIPCLIKVPAREPMVF
jgi:hypothetical protein